MPLISWNDELSVGIMEIDEQHQKLIKQLNDLYDAMKHGHGYAVVGTTIRELIEYTDYHFTTEERLFRKYDFPDAEDHLKQHWAFTSRVQVFARELEEGRSGVPTEVLTFLSEWLTNHIRVSDKRLGPFLKKHGME